MSSIYEGKPGDKTGRKGRKADAQAPKTEQAKAAKRDRRKKDQTAAMTVSGEPTPAPVELVTAAPNELFQTDTAIREPEIVAEQPAPMADSTAVAAAPVTAAAEVLAPAPAALASGGAPATTEARPVSIQTIANAYGDYTRNSLQETRSYVAKLMEVRSVDKAFEVQSVFAKRAYENFVAESQKIFDLYGQLARQTLNSWQACAGKATQTRR